MTSLLFFGVPLDPWDGEDRVRLKRAYISASIRGKTKFPQFRDPYDALIPSLKTIFKKALFKGKIPVDSWLWPTPEAEDLVLVTSTNYAVFIDTDGCREYSDIQSSLKHFNLWERHLQSMTALERAITR